MQVSLPGKLYSYAVLTHTTTQGCIYARSLERPADPIELEDWLESGAR